MPTNERNEFIRKLDTGEKRVFLKRVLYLVERLDEVQKAQIVGRLLRAYGRMSQQYFLRLSMVIDRIYCDDLTYFNMSYNYSSKVREGERRSFFEKMIIKFNILKKD